MGYYYVAMPWEKLDARQRVSMMEFSLRASVALMKEGFSLVHPVATSSRLVQTMAEHHIEPFTHSQWLALDTPLLAAAAGMFVMAEWNWWEESVGVKFEINYMTRLGHPVRYVYQDGYSDPTLFKVTLAPRSE